jgi:DivIVA domain-containing protein
MSGDDPAEMPRNDPGTASPPSGSAWAIRSMVERARFSPVRVREGYDMAEVDEFLDRLVEAAERGEPVAPLVESVEFTRIRVHEGYEIGEVDHFLKQLTGAAPVTADPGVIHEQHGLLGRLLGRR